MLKDSEHHEPINKFKVSPAAEHLFKIRDNSKPLSETNAGVFHDFTAKGLYLSKQAIQDTITAISFLCTTLHHPRGI